MILTFRDKRAELFAKGEFVWAFQGFDRQKPCGTIGPVNIRSASINNSGYVSSGLSPQQVRQT
jgi:hypothetical protein